MVKKDKNEYCCGPVDTGMACKVESLVSVDERGQMVLPKEIREKANIRAGDKLALISWEKRGEICCLALINVKNLTDMIKGLMGTMAQEILQK